MNEKGSGVSPMMGGGVVGGGGAGGLLGGAGGLLGGAGGLLGGAGWGLGVGSFPRFNKRSMKPRKPPPLGGWSWAAAHCGLTMSRQLHTTHRLKSFLTGLLPLYLLVLAYPMPRTRHRKAVQNCEKTSHTRNC